LGGSVAWLAERAQGARQVSNCEDQWTRYSTGTFPRHLGEFAGSVALALS